MMTSEVFLLGTIMFALLVETLTEAKYTKPTKGCPSGCQSCSKYNGCFVCKPNFYFLLYRSGMKQTGVCTHACPTGYYHDRTDDYYRCSRCRVSNCSRCFDKYYCALCEPPYFSHEGHCVLTCPSNMYEDEITRDCKVKVDCSVTDWSAWSTCTKNGRPCGYKWGEEARSRVIEVSASPEGSPCPPLSEERRCRMRERYCLGTEPEESKSNRKKTNSTRDRIIVERPHLTKAERRRRRKKKLKLSLRNNDVELNK